MTALKQLPQAPVQTKPPESQEEVMEFVFEHIRWLTDVGRVLHENQVKIYALIRQNGRKQLVVGWPAGIGATGLGGSMIVVTKMILTYLAAG